MSILIPGTSHQITWSIQNLTDTTTYYVKAVIRDLRTNIILDTLYLTDLGNGRFSKTWNVPQDGQGFGRQIEIEKTVYEDSAYTIPSGLYGRWLDEYTIFNLANRLPSTGGYGGHGTQVDYKEITTIIKKEIAVSIELLKNIIQQEKTMPTDITVLEKNTKSILNELSEVSRVLSVLGTQNKKSVSSLDDISFSIQKVKQVTDKSIDAFKNQLPLLLNKEIIPVLNSIKDLNKKEIARDIAFDKKIETELSTALKKFGDILAQETKKFAAHVSEAMSKPFNITLSPEKNDAQDETKIKRANAIKRLIS